MRILLPTVGSYGDVLPFVAVGQELKKRGHDVTVIASPNFEAVVGEAGLELVPLGKREDYESAIRHPDAFHPQRGLALIGSLVTRYVPEAYRLLEANYEPGNTLVVASTLAFHARLLQETRSAPLATLHLAPSIFQSVHEMPRLQEVPFPGWLPRWARRGMFWAGETFVSDPAFAPGLNVFRRELGLPPVQRVFGRWIHGADVVIGMFPSWFAPAQPDWPEHVHLTGFPLYDRKPAAPLDEDTEAFVDAGPPPVLFTTGTATTTQAKFFRESVEACRALGVRGLMLTKFREQLPERLPEGVRHVSYAPFSLLLSRAAAFVHHGGVGTMSQALAAGVPQLVRPMAFDQFDNGERVEKLGVGEMLFPRAYEGSRVADALDRLRTSPEIRRRCDEVRDRVETQPSVADTVDIILRELAPRDYGVASAPAVS